MCNKTVNVTHRSQYHRNCNQWKGIVHGTKENAIVFFVFEIETIDHLLDDLVLV
jgi:hypothetical protein